MQFWRFLTPSALTFTLRNIWHGIVDKVSGAPVRPVRVAQYVSENATKNDPADVLSTIDRFAVEVRWLMNVGPKKGPLIQELAARLPNDAKVLELGAYCGYSSIMLANALGASARVTSIEINKDNVDSARKIVEIAGLSDRIEFLHGSSTDVLEELNGPFDLVFLDHWKDLYKTDLQLMERRKIVGPGTIVVADNVGEIFNPSDYLTYVRECGRYDSDHREAEIEYTHIKDAVEISVYR